MQLHDALSSLPYVDAVLLRVAGAAVEGLLCLTDKLRVLHQHAQRVGHAAGGHRYVDGVGRAGVDPYGVARVGPRRGRGPAGGRGRARAGGPGGARRPPGAAPGPTSPDVAGGEFWGGRRSHVGPRAAL